MFDIISVILTCIVSRLQFAATQLDMVDIYLDVRLPLIDLDNQITRYGNLCPLDKVLELLGTYCTNTIEPRSCIAVVDCY